MRHQLLTFDYVFWYITIVCQVAACCALVRRKQFFQHWKIFAYYLFYSTGVAIFMLAMALFASISAFATAYSILGFVEAIFLNLVLLEILVKVLDPFESLPGRTVAKFCFWAVLGISTAVAFSVMMPSGKHGPLYDIPVTIERTIFLADAALLWTLLVQAKKLGITWKSSVAEIAIGFVLYLTVQSTTQFVASIYSDRVLRSISTEVGQFAFLIAVLGWIWTITHRDPLDTPLSSETVAKIQQPHEEDESVTKERIFAAVGIKMNKPEEKLEEPAKQECGANLH
ncbi:MAG: hypothetical protein WCG81_06500 [Candidatus Angelobacter sp.]